MPRAVINASPLAVLSFSPDGVVTSWNPGAQRIFGYDEKEAIGRPNPCVPASRLLAHLDLLTRTSEGTAISGYETVRQRRDGSQFPHAALDIARGHPGVIDLLVTDVVMPGLRGPELYQRILEIQPRIQVLFMSG